MTGSLLRYPIHAPDRPKPRPPDFFCIGAEKCGTTWLWRMLRDHPDVGVHEVKELRYFTYRHLWGRRAAFRRFYGGLTSDWSRIRRLGFELRLAIGSDRRYLRTLGALGDRPVVGDITPQYCLLPDAGIAHMQRLAPQAKIILLMRDPVERAISGSKMKLSTSGVALSDEVLLQRASHRFQLRMSRYSRMLERFEAAFPGRVFTGFLDDIASRPQQVLQDLCGFLGLAFRPEDFPNAQRISNQGTSHRPDSALQRNLYDALRDEYDCLGRRFPDQVARWRQRYAQPAPRPRPQQSAEDSPAMSTQDTPPGQGQTLPADAAAAPAAPVLASAPAPERAPAPLHGRGSWDMVVDRLATAARKTGTPLPRRAIRKALRTVGHDPSSQLWQRYEDDLAVPRTAHELSWLSLFLAIAHRNDELDSALCRFDSGLTLAPAVFSSRSFAGTGRSSGALQGYRRIRGPKSDLFEKIFIREIDMGANGVFFYREVLPTVAELVRTPALRHLSDGAVLTQTLVDHIDIGQTTPAGYPERMQIAMRLAEAGTPLPADPDARAHHTDFELRPRYFMGREMLIELLLAAHEPVQPRDALAARMERLAAVVRASPRHFCHGDLSSVNVFAGGMVVDWDMCGVLPFGWDQSWISMRRLPSQTLEGADQIFDAHMRRGDRCDDSRRFCFLFFLMVFLVFERRTAAPVELIREIFRHLETLVDAIDPA